MRRLVYIPILLLAAWSAGTPAGLSATVPAAARQAALPDLRLTVHPPLPVALSGYWHAPAATWKATPAAAAAAAADLGKALTLIENKKAAQALPLIRVQALAQTPLRHYAVHMRGLAELQLGRFAEARRTFAGVRAAQVGGAVVERATMREAEAASALSDHAAALAVYDALLLSAQVVGIDEILLRAARAADAMGDPARAATYWRPLYFRFPATEGGTAAVSALAATLRVRPAAGSGEFQAELDRSERLFQARRYALARDGFERLALSATGETADLVSLRLGACDVLLKRHRQAVTRLRTVLDAPGREAEAQFHYLSATRALGNHDQFVQMVRQLVAAYSATPWAEDALNSLASHYLIVNEDELADGVFREILRAYPAGRHAPRASWKAGWWAYKHGRDAEAVAIFERAASAFPRSDYRPSWLYWAGRSRERLGDVSAAADRYRLAIVDYANSYYGRLARERLTSVRGAPPPTNLTSFGRWRSDVPAAVPGPAGPDLERIAWLVSAGLPGAALDELALVQKAVGRTVALDATRAWILHEKGELRPAISVMRQTYPHFLAAGGENLPIEIQKVIFPLAHWPLIRQHAAQHKLDPFLVAALVAQESTFDPKARSSANAIGLMQVVPSTGRRWARKLGLKQFSARSLTDPVTNVRIGTAYFADQVRRFGGVHFALAGYNAGDHRVSRWMAERPGLPQEEFIDDIPFPETQNYVKRILGTAEDYQRLYGGRQ